MPLRTMLTVRPVGIVALGSARGPHRWTAAVVRRPATDVAAEVPTRPVSLKSLTTSLMTRPEAVLTAARLPDREVGRGACGWRLIVGARQLGTNQWPMHRTILASRFRFGIPILDGRGGRRFWLVVGDRLLWRRHALRRWCRHRQGNRRRAGCLDDRHTLRDGLVDDFLRRTCDDLRVEGSGFRLAALPRHARVLVLVIRVACRAARLLHLVPHHCHDGMVRQPTLSGTVVVQNVTKPKLALLHQRLPRVLAGG